MATRPENSQLRLRVFAGPNGSGKSTIIQAIRDSESGGRKIDIGIYINADDIARLLVKQQFSFEDYGLKATKDEFFAFADASGLINLGFSLENLKTATHFL